MAYDDPDFGDDFDNDYSEVSISPLMLMDSIMSNALHGRLTLSEVYMATQLASDAVAEEQVDSGDLYDEFDGLFKFEAGVDASLWLKQTVNTFYGRGFTPISLDDEDAAEKVLQKDAEA